MRAVLVKGLDMSGFESWKRMLLCYGTRAMISFRDENSKSSLAKAGMNYSIFSISSAFFFDSISFISQFEHSFLIPSHLQVFPDEFPSFFIQFIAFRFSSDNRSFPVGSGEPKRFIKEEGLSQDDAANPKILMGIIRESSKMT